MSSTAKNPWIVSERTFIVTMWTLCAGALLFLASRFAIRASTKGRLMGNDYFLVAAVPLLLVGFALLQSVIHPLYWIEDALIDRGRTTLSQSTDESRRLVAAIELIWIVIYCVKFCYLAQFKFYKPPYAYVIEALTRYYWTAIGLCSAGFLFTIVQPIALCSTLDRCRYVDGSNTRPWEIATTVIDIVTDLIVMSIPILLIHMANTIRSYTIANFVFKSLSIFNIVVAATRLAIQYDTTADRIRYVSVTFLLVIEAAVALIMVSISGYRVVFLKFLAGWEQDQAIQSTHLRLRQGRHPTATAVGGDGGGDPAGSTKATQQHDGSLSNLPMLSST